MYSIQRLQPGDDATYRSVRLRALEEAPDAFGTTHAEEAASDSSVFRRRLEEPDRAVFVAVEGDAIQGLARGGPYDWEEGAAGLFSLWVAPEARGRGVGGALVDVVLAWARAGGYARILLDVGDYNASAIRLYTSRGFQPTGVTSTLPVPREHVHEHQMACSLDCERCGT